MAVPGKQYGLILSQKKGKLKPATTSVFGDDSDEETSVGESLQKEAVKKRMMKQTRLEMHKALEQDSTVYDYDGVYDDIQKQRLETNKKILGGAERKPKYINQLMKAVEERKKEQERRDERKIQKEREAEGEQFADKEAYVTSAYKQKLLERKEEEEQEKKEAAMEAALDVKKQKDLSGFYRHLLNQTVGEEEIPDRSADKNTSAKAPASPERTTSTPPSLSPASHDHTTKSYSDSEEGRDQKTAFSKPRAGSAHAKRQYRQRSPSSGSGDDRERQRPKKSHRDGERDKGRDRDRGRDDRHRGRREDKDRRKDRDRERERSRDRSRGRRDGKEERHGKRERSPRERERSPRERERERSPREKEKSIREKERSPKEKKERSPREKKERSPKEKKERSPREKKEKSPKEKEKGKAREESCEPEREDPVKGKAAGGEAKEGGDLPHEDRDVEPAAAAHEDPDKAVEAEGGAKEGEEPVNTFAKRSNEQAVNSARERYLARQMARSACKSYVEKEED